MPATMFRPRPADLPDFERPPVNEVVLSLQFASLPFRNIHAGLLWERLKSKFAKVEEHHPIDPAFETFGVPQAIQGMPQFQMLSQFPPSRFWFITADDQHLLQVQGDRLIHNWRKRSPGDQYPRYEQLRERFEREVALVQEYWQIECIGTIAVNQCEVTYINQIQLAGGGDPTKKLEEIFTIWSGQSSDAFLTHEAERGNFGISYILKDSANAPYGRLHVTATPVIHRETNEPFVQLTLVARGRPSDALVSTAFGWFDHGRDTIVRAFASLTQPQMHRLWGRKNVN